MRRTLNLAFALILPFILAAPAWAGTVYVPYVGPVEIGDVLYETQIWASNTDEEAIRRIEHHFIPNLADGTERQGEPTLVRIRPGLTTRLQVSEQTPGLVEIFAAPQVVITARLVPVDVDAPSQSVGAQIPVISSSNTIAAGEIAPIQGWERIPGRVSSNLVVVNMGTEQTVCEVAVFRANGTRLGNTALIPLKPRTMTQFEFVLTLLGVDNARDVRAQLGCDQPFYAFGSLYQADPLGANFIPPSVSGKSELVRPGDEEKFVYLSDVDWSGVSNLTNGPFRDRTGTDPHNPAGPRFGYKQLEINGVAYEKGISWQGEWRDSWVEWTLDGQYKRFTSIVRIDDEEKGLYEWGVVNRQTGQFQFIERPPDGFRGRETDSRFRIGAGGRIRIIADGQTIYESPEFYAYGDAVQVDVDVTGVKKMRIEFEPDHSEQANAPHRAGLRSTPAPVFNCPWFDLLNLADAKLYPVN